MVKLVQIEGALNDWRGRLEESWGVMAHDPRMRAKGAWRQMVGTCQQRFPDAMREVGRARKQMRRAVRDAGDEMGGWMGAR